MKKPRAIAIALTLLLSGVATAAVVHPRSDATWGFITGNILNQSDLVLLAASGGGVAWGGITGTLSNQADLQTALNAKENTGVAAAGDAAHVAAGDPHPVYLTSAEGNAVYVTGPAGATDDHLALFSGATGRLLKNDATGLKWTSGTTLWRAGGGTFVIGDNDGDPCVNLYESLGIDYISFSNPSGTPCTPYFFAQWQSGVVTGTAPFTVDSTTRVTNLNADLLDGISSAGFEAAGAVAAHAAAADPHTGYQKESEKSAASGYASLNASTLVPTAELGTGAASSTTFLRGDSTWAAPTASVAISVAEIDFGTDAKFVAKATITDAAITATSKIIITQAGIAATGRQADENEMDDISCNALPATGSFTLRCHATNSPTHGKFNVWYTSSS